MGAQANLKMTQECHFTMQKYTTVSLYTLIPHVGRILVRISEYILETGTTTFSFYQLS